MKNFDCCFKRKLLALQPGMLSHIIKDQWLHFDGMPFIYVSVWLLSSDEKYMYGTVWDALRLFHSIFLPMSIPFQWILCWWVFVHTYLVTILGPDMAVHLKDDVSPSFFPPRYCLACGAGWQLSGREWHIAGHQTSWHFALSLWQPLTVNGYQADSLSPNFVVFWVLNVIITARRDVIIFSPWNMEALPEKWQQCSGIHRCVNDKIL